jgi:tape measure domain-containing protein
VAEVGALRVSLGLDSADFTRSIQDINRKLRAVESEFKAAGGSIKGFENTLEGLQAKSDMLTRKMELQRTKVEELRRRYDESAATKGRDAKETDNLLIQYNRAVAALKKMEAELNDVNQKIEEQSNELNDLQGEIDDTNGKMGGLQTAFSNFRQVGVAALAAVGAAFVSLGGIIGKVGIEYNAMKEQSQIAWETILGDAEKAKQTLKDLEELGAQTPFEFEGLDKAAKLLNMAGFEGEKLKETLVAVGDAVSAVGGGQDELEGVAMALFQMSAKGKVSAEEMNQLAERGIPAWEIMAEATGKSVQELMKMSEQGKLFSQDVLPELVKGFEERFGGAMQKQSQTFNGLMSTLKDNLKLLAGDLTQGLFEKLKEILPSVINIVNSIRDAFANGGLEGVFRKFLPPDIFNFLKGAFDTIKNIINGLVEYIRSLGSGENNVGQSFARIFEAVKSVAVPILQDAVNFIKDILDQLKKFWDENGLQIVQAVKNYFSIIASIIELVMPAIKFIIQTVWDSIKGIISGVLDAIMGLVKIFAGLFTGDFSKMWEGIKQLFSGAVEAIWNYLNFLFIGRILGGIKALATNALGGIKTMWSSISSAFKSFGKNILGYVKGLWNNVTGTFNFFKNTGLNIFQSFRGTVGTIWQALKSNVVNIANNLFQGAKNAFGKVLSTAKSIFNNVKSAITSPIETAKKIILGIIDAIKNAFSKMKITIPKPKLPKISVSMKTGVMGIPYPDFDISWHAVGGVFTKPVIFGNAGFGDVEEAIVPFEGSHARRIAGLIGKEMIRELQYLFAQAQPQPSGPIVIQIPIDGRVVAQANFRNVWDLINFDQNRRGRFRG